MDYFSGKFEIGVSLHACGVATDLVSLTIYVMDKSDRTSSVPSTVLRLKVDKGQGLLSGLLVSFNRVLPVQ